jgi:uncharacterized protein (DUF58 family)
MRRGGALVLGGAVLAAAIVFASRPLGVAGLGLVLAALISRAWIALASGPIEVQATIAPRPATEGDEVTLSIAARRDSRIPVGTVVVTGALGRLGAFECRFRGHGRLVTGEVILGELPRGYFSSSEAFIELRDPLGLESRSRPLGTAISAVVYPRLVELESLFSDAGRFGSDGRRLLLRRPAGFDLHSVRDYEQGESLRRVHWPTTARRGHLMVKELEESPRDSVVVVLDCDPAGQAGSPPDSSFDEATRAAGSILRVHASRSRRVVLVTTGKDAGTVAPGRQNDDFQVVLGRLAEAEPDAPHELARALDQARSPVAQAGELVIVTAVLAPTATARLLDLATRRLVSVVWVDAPSFAGRPTRVAPGALRLSAAGIPVSVVRFGDDLTTALQARRGAEHAHG